MYRYFVCCTLLVLGITGLLHARSKKSHCFSPDSIAQGWPLFTTTLNKQTCPKEPFEKPFTFLDSGNESYTFVSADHQYVLKFIKFPPPFAAMEMVCSLAGFHDWVIKERLKRQMHCERTLTGWTLAHQYDPNSCALAYVHLEATPLPFSSVQVIDRAGRSHTLSLTHVPFMLQKKAIPANQFLSKKIQKRALTDAATSIIKLLEMIKNSMTKGLYDEDRNLLHNSGFFENGHPMRIDMGKLTWHTLPQEKIEEEIEHLLHARITPWLYRHHKEAAEPLLALIREQRYQSYPKKEHIDAH